MLVVGAGPAGADLAIGLARSGLTVTLIDRIQVPEQAAFSSAALPLVSLEQFGIPAEVVAARWSTWQLIGPAEQTRHWRSPQCLGAVLDFAALRHWQLDQAARWGALVQLGTTAISTAPSHEAGRSAMVTLVRDRQGRQRQISSAWVVDASGQARALLGEPDADRHPLVSGVGLEWLLEVDAATWQRWADQLSFVLGSRWISQGYGWVFPMQPGRLKVGVCRLHDASRQQPPLGNCLQRLLRRCGLEQAAVIDRHGGLIRSSIARAEPHQRGRLLGLGDAVSTANLLGGEGIRHAMASSRVLMPLLVEAIRRQRAGRSEPCQMQAVAGYSRQLKRRLGWRWGLSGRLARRTWLGLKGPTADQRLDALLRGLSSAEAEELSALLFDYRFERYGFRALPDLLGWR